MLKYFKFKHKIMIMPLLALCALGLLLFISQLFMGRNNTLLVGIERSFVPALDLCRDLENTLTDLQRGMQDAVAAADKEELVTVDTFYQNFLKLFEQGRTNSFFQNDQLAALKTEFEEYYELARKTSQHLIEGGSMDAETVANLKIMGEKYNAIKTQLKTMTDLAKNDVSRSFATTLWNYKRSSYAMSAIILGCTLLFGGLSFFLVRSISTPMYQAIQVANQFAEGERQVRIPVQGHDELSELGHAFNRMMATLERQDWLKTGQATLNERMRGEQDIALLSRNIISYLAAYLDLPIGAMYLTTDEGDALQLTGSYAYSQRKGNRNAFKFGEGLIGQAALEKQRIVFSDVPENYIAIQSGVGEVTPRYIVVLPFLYENKVKGVIELGAVRQFAEREIDFLNQASESIAIALHSAQSRVKMQALLTETQRQSETLQTQQEELRQTNENLGKQAQALRASEEKLQAQQEELRQTNEELEGQARTLEIQKEELREKNQALEQSRQLIEAKAKELEISGKYKSEFLANMSHELRTPLNSLLILSKLLSENKEDNLTAKQLEYIRTIYSSGSELLQLINDVLDLSKVEAGKMALNIEEMSLKGLGMFIDQSFRHVATQKSLDLEVTIADGLPATISTDRQRVEQILKNLLSNAVKFTERGGVKVLIQRPLPDVDLSHSGLSPQRAIALTVVDTGIGIPADKQQLIFEAFQQADGTTSRKFGGTGLGLSISRELVKLLGGEIQLQSEPGCGSTFTIYLPESFSPQQPPAMMTPVLHEVQEREQTKNSGQKDTSQPSGPSLSVVSSARVESIRDDRHNISATDKSLLIIEDDPKFAKILFDLARERGFKGLVAGDGAAALQLAFQFKPSAITLDVGLPEMSGWAVMEKLKDNPDTRHIPVHFISAYDQALQAMKMGAIGYLTKPVSIEMLDDVFQKIEKTLSTTIKKLLIVETDETVQQDMFQLLRSEGVNMLNAKTGPEAYALLKSQEFDCMVVDLGVVEQAGFDLLQTIQADPEIAKVPIILYSDRELTKDEDLQLKKYAERIIIKGARSPERLLDEVTLFLQQVEADLPEAQQKKLRMIHDKEAVLLNKTILLVDDDMRNVFALSSVLEEKGMQVLVGENGREALKLLETHPEIDLVLLDIMMPEMDGYETMRLIRKQPRFEKLPIIALTAKAMKGDRQKCIDVGASDYLSKPIDIDKLLSLLRVWLY